TAKGAASDVMMHKRLCAVFSLLAKQALADQSLMVPLLKALPDFAPASKESRRGSWSTAPEQRFLLPCSRSQNQACLTRAIALLSCEAPELRRSRRGYAERAIYRAKVEGGPRHELAQAPRAQETFGPQRGHSVLREVRARPCSAETAAAQSGCPSHC